MKGDTSSYGAIVERYWKMAVALAISKINDINEAEDIAQSLAYAAWRVEEIEVPLNVAA